MRHMPFFLLLLSSSFLFAQDDGPWKAASKESHAYNVYRSKITIPPYGLEKVQKLIAEIKSVEGDNDTGSDALSPAVYASLTLREKFTYNMVHAEGYSQNCDLMPPIQDEQNKIFGHTPAPFDEHFWSDRQIDFFINNKDSVIKLMTESIKRSGRIGCNYKRVMIEVNATEMIPFLIQTNRAIKKDHDILTVLMEVMKANNYKPFITSISHEKLYGDESNFQAFINFNKANEDLIVQRATDFYNGLKK